MPNGGDVPCCGVCQYASKLADSSGIVCSKHDIRVTRDGSMFCADLSHPQYPGLSHFVSTSGIQQGIMYMWAGVYSGKELPLAPIETFAAWTEEERSQYFRAKWKAWKDEYRSKHGDDWF